MWMMWKFFVMVNMKTSCPTGTPAGHVGFTASIPQLDAMSNSCEVLDVSSAAGSFGEALRPAPG